MTKSLWGFILFNYLLDNYFVHIFCMFSTTWGGGQRMRFKDFWNHLLLDEQMLRQYLLSLRPAKEEKKISKEQYTMYFKFYIFSISSAAINNKMQIRIYYLSMLYNHAKSPAFTIITHSYVSLKSKTVLLHINQTYFVPLFFPTMSKKKRRKIRLLYSPYIVCCVFIVHILPPKNMSY